MGRSRRDFLKLSLGSAAALSLVPALAKANSGQAANDRPDAYGVLVDIRQCIGCRNCEAACNKINQLPAPAAPFTDLKALETPRRMNDRAYTVVNRILPKGAKEPANIKLQCMHCNDPACVSACIVGALTKSDKGPVEYDAQKCLGCRYCMVACPFGVPAYEYHNALTPQVRKCTFCAQLTKEGKPPACVTSCPKEALIFGRRGALLELARQKILSGLREDGQSQAYVNHIYGETEVGGTSWIYIAPVEFGKLGFLALPEKAPPRLTETIQHGVFKNALPPIALFSLLGAAMHVFKRRDEVAQSAETSTENEREARHE